MSNERERLARQWATSTLPKGDAKTLAAIEHIMATTPEPTMDEVEWDAEKHYMAGATSETDGSERVMIAPLDGLIVNAKPGGDHVTLLSPGALTPNGKKYELREVTDQPEHPETLCTAEDYENAPEGTIVALQGTSAAWVKDGGKWRRGTYAIMDSVAASAHARTVLRKGWGE